VDIGKYYKKGYAATLHAAATWNIPLINVPQFYMLPRKWSDILGWSVILYIDDIIWFGAWLISFVKFYWLISTPIRQ